MGYPLRTGLTVAAGLSQIGEFSFIVAGLGRTLGLLPEKGYHLIIAGAILSIILNPLMFRLVEPLEGWLRRRPKLLPLLERGAGAVIPWRGEYAHGINPDLAIIARTHSEREWQYLRDRVSEAVLGEREAALEMARYTLRRFGVTDPEIETTVRELRARVEMERPAEPLSGGGVRT